MTSNTIVNGAPMTLSRGTQDNSTRVPAVEAEVVPTHLPKIYLYAAKGPRGAQLVVGNARNQMYGDATFDLRSPFATHQTVLSNAVNTPGNSQMIERMIPVDAGPKANFLLSLDVLETTIVQNQRDAAGNFLLNPSTGLPIPITPAATLPGYKVKWVLSSITTKDPEDADSDIFGIAAQAPGDQTDGAEQSVRYPIFQWWANSEGEIFNNSGLRIWAPTDDSSGGIKTNVLTDNKAYPFRMAAVRRLTATSSAKLVETEAGEPNFDFVLKEGQINAAVNDQISLGDIYLKKFQTNDIRFAPKYADLANFKIYQENIDELLALFYALEKSHTGAGFDWTVGATDEMYMFNFLSGRSSLNSPYFTYEVDTEAVGSVRLSESTNLFAKGGADGTMNETLFAGLVSTAVSEYANPNSQLMDTAVNVESIIYDTGFPLLTKYDLCKVLAERKDTGVILSTHVVGGATLSSSEDHSVAVALRTKLQMYPDSDYFGTPVFRGLIMGRSGILRNSDYTKRLPLTIELAVKAATFMGAGNGFWKKDFLFDKAPNNVINLFDDVSNTFTPAVQRNKDWDVGLNYAMSYSRKQLYFPALKTAYDNDTSVLNSFFVMMCCIELQKVGERVHREFSGVTSLTNAQLIDRVNKEVEKRTTGRFAGMFKIEPAAFLSDADEQRGYSWSLPIKLYANGMKTVMTLSLAAHRMSDLDAAV